MESALHVSRSIDVTRGGRDHNKPKYAASLARTVVMGEGALGSLIQHLVRHERTVQVPTAAHPAPGQVALQNGNIPKDEQGELFNRVCRSEVEVF